MSNQDVYEISSKEDLNLLREHKNGDFILTSDIYMDIGSSRKLRKISDIVNNKLRISNFKPIRSFNGTIDGQGNKIKNLKIFKGKNSGISLIRRLGEEGVIKNLELEDYIIVGEHELSGGIVAYNKGKVKNCSISGILKSSTLPSGGIVGNNSKNSELINCKFEGKVIGGNKTGGAVGMNLGLLENINVSGKVKGNTTLGGIAGTNHIDKASIINCSSNSSLEVTAVSGGIVGYNGGKISKSYFNGSIKSEDFVEKIGILIGHNQNRIKNCYVCSDSNFEKIDLIAEEDNGGKNSNVDVKEDLEEVKRAILIGSI